MISNIFRNSFGIFLSVLDVSLANIFFARLPDGKEVCIGLTKEKVEIVFYEFTKEDLRNLKERFPEDLEAEERWNDQNAHLCFQLSDFMKHQRSMPIYTFARRF